MIKLGCFITTNVILFPFTERTVVDKPGLMVRSNPIGLAEPSVKRDGYAVGKDGSFYRSSENLFENNPSR